MYMFNQNIKLFQDLLTNKITFGARQANWTLTIKGAGGIHTCTVVETRCLETLVNICKKIIKS